MLESLVVFWQQYDVSPQGSLYVQRYKVNTFPHVALLDPRTGLSRWQRSGFVSAEFMTDKVKKTKLTESREEQKKSKQEQAPLSSAFLSSGGFFLSSA